MVSEEVATRTLSLAAVLDQREVSEVVIEPIQVPGIALDDGMETVDLSLS